MKQGDDVITPEHMLARNRGPRAAGASLSHRDTRRDVPPQPSPLGFADASFRVLLLEGEAADWEPQLNACAALGYELVEIVDRRAIFRR